MQHVWHAGSHGGMQPHMRQASPAFHTSRPFRAHPEPGRALSPDLSTMYSKGLPKSTRSAPRSPRAKRKASLVGPVQVHIQFTLASDHHNDDTNVKDGK